MNEIEKRFNDVLLIRNLQPNSIGTYISIFRSFMQFCETNDYNPMEIELPELNSFVSSSASSALMRQRIGVIKTLYEFVFNQGYKTFYMPYPKKKFHLPDYLTPFELNEVFILITNKKQRTIVKLQYACALRVHEVVKIKRSDFIKKYDGNLQKFIYDLRVCGKGGSMREIPVPDETILEIFEYWRSLKNKPSEYLFEGQFKEYYSERSVQIVMKRAMRKLGINKYGSTHILRHSKASHLIQAGVDIRFIQKLLGHKNIKTTEIYTNFKTSDMRVIFNKAEIFTQQSIDNQQKLLKSA